jgi:complex iron-sulfur molybdoenzyme family reductase subunit gamma
MLFTTDISLAEGLIVMAKKVSGELPLDPASGMWRDAMSVTIPLAPQAMAKPRIYESKTKELKIRALHNAREIAFLLVWKDDTEDASPDVDKFSDAVALQFPSASTASKPHFAMGDKENTVNIWFWKAAWQKQAERGRTYATTDDFAGGMQAGNPVSLKRESPAENIVAQGFGSATDLERGNTQEILGKGIWQGGTWSVVLKRTLTSEEKLDVNFKEGAVIPLAAAVWNGFGAERGGRKVVSTWYYVGLETEEKKTTYFYPVLGLIAAVGIEAGIIIGIRKRRRT